MVDKLKKGKKRKFDIIRFISVDAILVPFAVLLFYSLVIHRLVGGAWNLIIPSYIMFVCGVVIWMTHKKRALDRIEGNNGR